MLRTTILAAASWALASWSQAQTGGSLRLVQTIPLPGVEGKMDHMAINLKGMRLFVPSENDKSIEIVDLRTGTLIHRIRELGGAPRKIIYKPDVNQFWVDLASNVCKSYDADSYTFLKEVPLSPVDAETGPTREPDNGIYDPATQLFYIGNRGDLSKAGAKGSIDIVDTKRGSFVKGIKVDDSDPAAFGIDRATSKLYVLYGATSQVAVLDLQKHNVLALWPITGGNASHAMTLDAAHHRLFIGSRVQPGHFYKPGKMIVMDSDSGKVIQALDSEGGADELEIDPSSQLIYLTGASGGINVYKELDPDHYKLIDILQTGALAKTSLLVPELKRLYVAVPKHIILIPPIPQSAEFGVEDAKILVFEVP